MALRTFGTRVTPQSQPIPLSSQVANSAGGYAWAITDWQRLDRFLILGTDGGTYYIGERELTRQNAESVLRCIQADGPRTVARIIEISKQGRAPRNDPALFALALAASHGDAATRLAAFEALPQVARIGTHIQHFAQYVQQFRGWGRGLRGAVATWYQSMPADRLAYQAIKYQSRDGWSHRDLLRLAHPKTDDATRNAVYHWMVKGWAGVGDEPHPNETLRLIWAFERVKRATDKAEVVKLIADYRLPREAVPTQWLSEADVWAALLATDMPMTALVRNLATLTRVGLLAPMGEWTGRVTAQLTDAARLRSARVHPIALLAALKTYAQGKGERGDNTWTPVSAIVDALDAAFYLSFQTVEATGQRWLLGLDVSGSMHNTQVNGMSFLSCHEATGAMALITAATEPRHAFVAFDTKPYPLAISPRQRLDDVVSTVSRTGGGGTDCAAPILWAMQTKTPVDVFAIYTDSESWAGPIHAAQAIQAYRERMGIPAKLVTVALASNTFTQSNPNDARMLDVIGFDTAVPDILRMFAQDQTRPDITGA